MKQQRSDGTVVQWYSGTVPDAAAVGGEERVVVGAPDTVPRECVLVPVGASAVGPRCRLPHCINPDKPPVNLNNPQ
eukprot:2886445-Pyramimonas_sp.AAC.1